MYGNQELTRREEEITKRKYRTVYNNQLKIFAIIILLSILSIPFYLVGQGKEKLCKTSIDGSNITIKPQNNHNITTLPLDSFEMGCGCIWGFASDSTSNKYFGQCELTGKYPEIVIDGIKTKMSLISTKLIERVPGVEHIGDSLTQIWENEQLIVKFRCIKTFTCNDDTSSKKSESCELTIYKGILTLTNKETNKDDVYSIIGECGC